MITVKQISSKKDKKKFFKFLIDLYKGNEFAAPNLYMDEFSEFDPEINDAFRFCDCKMFLAYKGGKIAGRVAGIWHRGANERAGLKQLRFTRFDVIDDFEVTKALFRELLKWAQELGMDEIIGPISFSDLNEQGMLIEGFDKPSTYIEIYNYPYYVEHMEKLGAYKAADWNCYVLRVPDEIDGRYLKLADMIAKRNGYELLDIKYLLKHDKKQLDKYVMECLNVLDEAFAELYGTSPLSEKQMAREMKTIYMALKPEFGAVVLQDGKVVSYGFMMPSMTKVLQKSKGRIFPFGILPYMRAMKKVEVADMMSIGVTKEHTNKGSVALIIASCLKGLKEVGVKYVETGPELDYNDRVQNLWKNFDRQLVKKHRCWGIKVEELDKLLNN